MGRPRVRDDDRRPGPHRPRRRRRTESRRAHHQEFFRAPPIHHPLGHQFLYRSAYQPHSKTVRRRFPRLLDARRHVGRRHGFYLRPKPKSRSTKLARGADDDHAARAGARPAFRHGAGRLRFRHQRPRHLRPASSRSRSAPAQRLLRDDDAPLAAHRSAADVAPSPRRDGRLRRRLPQPAGTFRHGPNTLRSPVPQSPDRISRRERPGRPARRKRF